MTIRCIQIGTTIMQGEASAPACENCPGWTDPNCSCLDYAEIEFYGKKFTGKLVQRKESAQK